VTNSDDPRGGGNAPTGASRFSMLVCSPKGEDVVSTMILVGGGDILRVFTDGEHSGWHKMTCTRLDYEGGGDPPHVHSVFQMIAGKAGLEEVPVHSMDSHGLYEIIEST